MGRRPERRLKRPPSADKGVIAEYLDLGSYAPDKAETVSLDKPSTLPGLSNAELVSEMGAGVVRGDVANPKLAPMHPESQRLADVLNRLGLNALEGAATVTAEVDGKTATTPQELMQALMATGHSVVIYGCAVLRQLRALSLQGAGCDDAVLRELADCDSGDEAGRCWFR